LISGVFLGRLRFWLQGVVPIDWVLGLAIRDEVSRVCHGHAVDHLARELHDALDLLRCETTAKAGIAMKRSLAVWHSACIRTELGILMQLRNPFSHGLDAPLAWCYKLADHNGEEPKRQLKNRKGVHQWRRMFSKACHRHSAQVTR
jgi:hypothetical protein